MSPPPGMTFDPDDDPLDAMAEGRERRLVPVHPPQTIDNETGKPIDPRALINVPALLKLLDDCAHGRVQLFDGQIRCIAMMLDRAMPSVQNVKVDGEVRHKPVPADITPEQAHREYLDFMGRVN